MLGLLLLVTKCTILRAVGCNGTKYWNILQLQWMIKT